MSSSLSEHLPLLASAPDGIKKLRGLILELAVRGKLVEQDPDDEPASELLKRIAVTSSVRRSNPASRQTDTIDSFKLPRGWSWVTLPDLCVIGGGATPSKAKSAYWGDGLPWVSPKDMKTDWIADAQDHVTHAALTETRLPLVPAGSLLIVVRGMILVHSFPVAITLADVTINQDMKSLTPLVGELAPFLATALKGFKASILALVARSTHGTCKLESDKIFGFRFGLPPLAEQRRIVAKVDELMALCDRLEAEQADSGTAHAQLVETLLGTLTQSADADELGANWQRLAEHFDTLFSTEASIDALKQTILQLAVMGKLVPQDSNDEPAIELLKRIVQERARSEAEGVCKKSKQISPISEDERAFNVPDGWEWLKFGTVVDLINGDRSKNYPNREEYVPTGVAWINTGHIKPDGTLTTEGMHFISREKFDSLRSGKIEAHDVVYCLRGATFGKTAFVTPYSEGAIASSLVIVRPHLPSLKSYIFLYLTSPLGRSQIFRFDNGSAQPNLSANSVTLYAFPLPPLAEQHRIVAKVDELMALCDRLKADLVDSRSRQARLADTLIAAALEAA